MEQIYRKKSLDRVKSPEELNDYVRVTNPGIWMILIAVVILLVGVVVWAATGKLYTMVSTTSTVSGGKLVCLVKEEDIQSIKTGMEVFVNDKKYKINEIDPVPDQVDESFEEYSKHIGDLQEGEFVYKVFADCSDLPEEGIYQAEIATESVSPLYFITN